MATKVTIQDIANELQLSRNTVSKQMMPAVRWMLREDGSFFSFSSMGDRHADDPVSEQLSLFLHDAGSFPVGNRASA